MNRSIQLAQPLGPSARAWCNLAPSTRPAAKSSPDTTESYVLESHLDSANPNSILTPLKIQSYYVNYFLGGDAQPSACP